GDTERIHPPPEHLQGATGDLAVDLDVGGVLCFQHDLGAPAQIQSELDGDGQKDVDARSERCHCQEQAPRGNSRQGRPTFGPAGLRKLPQARDALGQRVKTDTAPQVAISTPTTSRKVTRPERNSPSTPSGRSPRRWRYQARPLPTMSASPRPSTSSANISSRPRTSMGSGG